MRRARRGSGTLSSGACTGPARWSLPATGLEGCSDRAATRSTTCSSAVAEPTFVRLASDEYNDASEWAWLVGDDHDDLREACETIADLAPAVAEQMAALEVMAFPPTTTFADRGATGPWFSASDRAVDVPWVSPTKMRKRPLRTESR